MKNLPKILILLTIIFCAFALQAGTSFSRVYAAAPNNADIVYAYLNGPVMLYSKDSKTLAYTPLTSLPQTYFVALLEDAENESEYVRVAYADLAGYVKKTEIEICDYEPVTKYASAFLTMNSDKQPVNLRSTPDHTADDNIEYIIPHAEKAFYYGSVEGTALYPQIGNTWYYAKFEIEDKVYFGYIYSSQVSVERISTNIIEKIIKPSPEPEPEPNLDDNITGTENKIVTTAIIICLTIPAVLIMLLLFQKPPTAKRKPRHG